MGVCMGAQEDASCMILLEDKTGLGGDWESWDQGKQVWYLLRVAIVLTLPLETTTWVWMHIICCWTLCTIVPLAGARSNTLALVPTLNQG